MENKALKIGALILSISLAGVFIAYKAGYIGNSDEKENPKTTQDTVSNVQDIDTVVDPDTSFLLDSTFFMDDMIWTSKSAQTFDTNDFKFLDSLKVGK